MHKPLAGKTIVVTGSTKTSAVLSEIEVLGGEAVFLPLIETRELIRPDDFANLQQAFTYDWFIFTSQNAVEAFSNKLRRHQVNQASFKGKIAAVGSKTAQSLLNLGFAVNFTPSIFSADIFAKEFPEVAGDLPSCLFFRGNKAKDTLKNGLPFPLTEWTVYGTYPNRYNVEPLMKLLQLKEQPIVIFASPSAVDVFAEQIAPVVGWEKAKFASIGHITTAKLAEYGAAVTYQPSRYTMQSVVNEISRKEGNAHDTT